MLFRTKTHMVSEADALPGRPDQTMPVPESHFVNGHPLVGPWPEGLQTAVFGARLLLGRREDVLADAGRVLHGGRLRRRLHAEPDL